MPKGCIIYCIEKGQLEKHTLLSIASIREFGGELNQFDIYCLQPRKEFPISRKTKNKLNEFGVTFIDKPMNITHRYYALANKPFACEYIMDNYVYDQYLFLDSDTLIVDDPVKYFSKTNEINVSPVNSKGVGIQNLNDVNGKYWLSLFEKTGVNKENLPAVETVTSKEKIISYWNSGVILFNGQSSICRDWKKLLTDTLSQKDYPDSGVFFTEQTCLSAVLLGGNYTIGTLPKTCNFPLTKKMMENKEFIDLENASIIHHYNNLEFFNNCKMQIIDPMKNEWIQQQTKQLGLYPSVWSGHLVECGIQLKMSIMEKIYFFIYKFSSN